MSNIISIIEAVLNLNPKYSGESIPTRSLDQLQDVLQDADCPIRMISVADGGQSGDLAFIAMGKLQHITWTLTDRLYLKKSSLGEGSAEWSKDLILYAADYAERVRQNRSPLSQVTITEVSINPGVFNWPEGSERNYSGVECVLTIDEWISGA